MRILSIIVLCSTIYFNGFSQESNIEDNGQIKTAANIVQSSMLANRFAPPLHRTLVKIPSAHLL